MNNNYLPPTNLRPREIELIRSMARKNPQKPPLPYVTPDPNDNAFTVKPAGTWLTEAVKAPPVKKLFDGFWFEHELCILFADTNAGKSVLAVQIGDSLSRGEAIGNFEKPHGPSRVLYLDFELSDAQFAARYHHGEFNSYSFNPNFLRAVFDRSSPRARKFGSFQQHITNDLENTVINTGAKVLIIDNITCLQFDTYAANGALNLVRSLQQLKTKYGLSILVLAHTPKRNPVRPLSQNDLQGSKMLINFCDSAFAIGQSYTAVGVHYLKQIKQRSIGQTYGADKVCLCTLSKKFNFLQFEFTGYDNEANHLANYTEQLRRQNDTAIADLHKQGLSTRQIAAKLNFSSTTVFRALKRIGTNV